MDPHQGSASTRSRTEMVPRVFPDLPLRTTWILRNSLLPLQNHDVSEHLDKSRYQDLPQHGLRKNQKRRLEYVAKQARDEIQLACVLDVTPKRPVHEIPRA